MLPLPLGAVRQTLILVFLLFFIEETRADKKVVCYYTNWSVYRPGTAKFNPQNINPYLCTHLIYAFGGFTKDNTLKAFDKYQDIEQGGYAKFTGLKTYNKNLKTLLAIGGWNEGSSRFSPLVANPERRHQFIKNILKFLRQNHFDGLDLDWEYPAHRDGGKSRDKENYALFVQELRAEFDRESSKTGRPRLLLTMAVPAGIEYIEKGYDIPKLNKYLDWFNILSYDYHSAYEPSVNHHAPLYPLQDEDDEYNFDGELNIDYTIKHYLKAGADRDKLVLGIPTYGRSYTLINEDSTDIGAPSDGPGEQGDATREKGYLAYYEICQNIKTEDDWTVVQPNPKSMGPYAFKKNQWVGYDDEDIVKKKAEYVVSKGLGGIMFWSIDNDDFRGNCNGRPYPLIEAAKEAMFDRYNDNEVIKQDKVRKPGRSRSQSNSSTRNQAFNNEDKKKPQNRIKQTESRKRISSTTTSTTTTPIPVTRTTPAPPTTPDPGADFKCEDEGFFPHPRDCKKYYWCLDSGPSNLGLIAHQFTCPSGLYFNPAADSCDFTRNVLCKKNIKQTTTKATTVATTKATTTTLTTPSKAIKLKTTSTTPEPEYENYEDDDQDEDPQIDEEKGTTKDPEEDPKVIKELIDLIKKVGGIKELEKLLQQDDQDNTTGAKNQKNSEKSRLQETFTGKSLYSKVLGRQNSLTSLKDRFSTLQAIQRNSKSSDITEDYKDDSSSEKYSSVVRNSRPRPQNDGINKLAEFDGFLREKPKYVTLNRSRPAATKSDESKSVDNKKVEEEDNDEDEDNEDEDDNEDDNERGGFRSGVTSEKPQLSSTLSYINIRRTLPSTTTAVPSLELTVATTEFSKVDETKTKVPPSFLRNRYKTLVRSNTQNVTNQNEYEEEEPPNVTVINTENNENTQAPKRKFVTYNATERRTTIPATQTVQAEDQQESTTKSYIKQTNTNNIFSLINTHNIRTTQSTSPTTIQQPLIETSSYSSIPTKDPLFSTISTISNETNLDLTEVPLDFESIDKKLDETTVSNTDKTNESDLLNLDNEINFNKENDTININEKIFNSTQSNCSNIEVLKEGSHSDINFIHCNDGESSYTKTSTKSTPLDETTTPFLGTISSPRPFTPIHKRIRIRPVIKNSLNKTSSLENSNSSSVESETNNKNNDVTINKNYSKGINNTDAQAKGDYESTTKQINGRRIRVLKFKRPVTNTVEDKSILKSNSTKTEFSEKNEQLDSTTKIPLRKKVFIRKRPLTTTIASTASGVELNEGNATEIESKESEFKHSDRRIKYIKKIILKNDTSTEKKGTEVDGNENLTIDLKNVDNKFDEEVADRITNLTDKEAVTNFREKIYLNRRPIRPTKLPGTSSTTKDLDDSVSENVNDSLNLTNLDRGKSKFRVGFSNIRNGNFTEKSVVSENEIKKANDLNYKTIVRTNYLNRKVEQASIGDYNKTIINVNENESENNEQKSDDDEDDDYDDEDDDDENDDENDYNDENYDNNEEKLEKDKEKPLNENFNKIGLINNFDSNSFNNRIRTNLQNYTNRRQNVPVGINRNITTKKSNRFRINRPNNIPKISNRNFPTTTPHPISNQISVTTTFPLTTPSIFKSTNTKLRKYTTVTSTTESTLKDDLLLDLNVNALNARNKKIFEITSKKHTTVKPKPKEQISILDNENNISNVNETQTTDISELSEKNVKSYSNNDLNNFQETALENSIQGSSPITEQPPVTTTQKATTFSHIFSVGNINGISTTEMSEIEKDISTTIENEEKLVEINRVVEVSSKENKLKLKSIGVDLDNIKTSDIKLVEPPHIDKLGEISRVKYVTLVESGEDYSTTKSYDELHNENIKYNDNILNESEKRGRQLILPEVIRGIETSTIPLEGLFKTYRKSKANEIHYNSPVYALSLGEAYITSKPITNDDDISYEPVYKGESKDEKIQEDIKTTTSSFLFDTTTVQQDRTTNYIRPIVPLLRPESNESSPLVISIANLDKVILSKVPKSDSNSAQSIRYQTYIDAPKQTNNKINNNIENITISTSNQLNESNDSSSQKPIIQNVNQIQQEIITSYSSETHVEHKKIKKKRKHKTTTEKNLI